jgi:hypothetical protein
MCHHRRPTAAITEAHHLGAAHDPTRVEQREGQGNARGRGRRTERRRPRPRCSGVARRAAAAFCRARLHPLSGRRARHPATTPRKMCCSSTRVEYAGCPKYTAVSPRCTTLSTPAIWSYRSVSGVGPPTRFAEEQRLESTLRGIGIAEVVGGRTIRHFGQQSYRFRALFCLSALHTHTKCFQTRGPRRRLNPAGTSDFQLYFLRADNLLYLWFGHTSRSKSSEVAHGRKQRRITCPHLRTESIRSMCVVVWYRTPPRLSSKTQFPR